MTQFAEVPGSRPSPELVQAVQVLRRLLPPDVPTRRRVFAEALATLTETEA